MNFGLDTALDKTLFGIAIILTIILIVVVVLFWRRRDKVVPKVSADADPVKAKDKLKQKVKNATEYPTITVIKKQSTGPEDDEQSDVSSIWDTSSQQHDKKYFTEMALRHQIDKCLTAASKDIEKDSDDDTDRDDSSSCTGEVGSTAERLEVASRKMHSITQQLQFWNNWGDEVEEGRDADEVRHTEDVRDDGELATRSVEV